VADASLPGISNSFFLPARKSPSDNDPSNNDPSNISEVLSQMNSTTFILLIGLALYLQCVPSLAMPLPKGPCGLVEREMARPDIANPNRAVNHQSKSALDSTYSKPDGTIEYALLSSAVCAFANLRRSQTMVCQRIKRHHFRKPFRPLQSCRLRGHYTGACQSFRRLNELSQCPQRASCGRKVRSRCFQ
jgi:hypothetical protein